LHPDEVVFADPSPDGLRLATAYADGTARIWKVPREPWRGMALPHRGSGEANPVLDAVFDHAGLRIVTGAQDGKARVWEARTGELRRVLPGGAGPIPCVRFSPNGRFIATGSRDAGDVDGCAEIWDAQTGGLVGEPIVYHRPWKEVPGTVEDVAFSPDNRLFLVHGNRPLMLFELGNASFTEKFSKDLAVSQSVAFAPDGQRFAVGSDGCSPGFFAQIFNLAQDQNPISLPHHEKTPTVRFAPDGSCVATASWDGSARIWNATDGKPVSPRLNHNGALFDVEFSPDSKSVVTASTDATARIWSVATGLALTDPLRHKGYVVSASFSPDGRMVATASRDASARLWDAQTGLPVSEALWHEGRINIARFSPDGRVLLTVSDDGTARLWPVPQINEPAPRWFLDLAEALAGQRLDAADHFATVDTSRMYEIGERCRTNTSTDFFARWGRWFFDRPPTTDPWNFPP
jgi:WD40 repeat protein